ncbi:hypothetical protein BCR41DRAFT_375399 [Lobosporangium transversale]|uniref:Uncharacterized protein n=1 Tax=Lobosporangium transversale TaxID=64571 RepID=A0A1Y2G759_9FUNG|nr:hypothetical protein BCR41DRAFT_375399 [Lobosporangium transversale]ORY99696.1 hypothetical protein BCR41DRAFT_375399 [Lobosporangium transversale]|eukprot:XP_021875960.1 hypothetical protein BCR41DRAFT_375399 [Lobosporangium transversale]
MPIHNSKTETNQQFESMKTTFPIDSPKKTREQPQQKKTITRQKPTQVAESSTTQTATPQFKKRLTNTDDFGRVSHFKRARLRSKESVPVPVPVPAANSTSIPMAFMTEEQVVVARRGSAKFILEQLLNKPSTAADKTLTIYKVYIRQWQQYWDNKAHEGSDTVDYTVNAARMVEFFNEVTFMRTTKKYVGVNTSYMGPVSIVPQVDTDEMPGPNAGSLWVPSSPPPNEDLTKWAVSRALEFTAQPASSKAQAEDPSDDNDTDDEDEGQDGAEHSMAATIGRAGKGK